VAAQLAPSQEGLSSMSERVNLLVIYVVSRDETGLQSERFPRDI
jgi:hypothetical protein